MDVVNDQETLDELRAENAELRVTVARLEERLAAGERRESEVRAAFARERAGPEELTVELRARADRLEVALAEARKPALLRLLEALWRR
jgi:hypothetical protein